MKLEKDKQYIVNLKVSSSILPEGQHILYFRDIFLTDDGLPVFSFSESLDYSSRFYNLFYPYDYFTVSLQERDSLILPAGCPCEVGRAPRAPL